jgi:hypothetical protein
MNHNSPVHVRFRLGGDGAPIGIGAISSVCIVSYTNVQFLQAELTVGAGMTRYDANVPAAGCAVPASHPLVVTIDKSTDQGMSWTDLYLGTPDGYPTLPIGSPYVFWPQDGSNHFAGFGDWLRARVIQCDGVTQNVVLSLSGPATLD